MEIVNNEEIFLNSINFLNQRKDVNKDIREKFGLNDTSQKMIQIKRYDFEEIIDDFDYTISHSLQVLRTIYIEYLNLKEMSRVDNFVNNYDKMSKQIKFNMLDKSDENLSTSIVPQTTKEIGSKHNNLSKDIDDETYKTDLLMNNSLTYDYSLLKENYKLIDKTFLNSSYLVSNAINNVKVNREVDVQDGKDKFINEISTKQEEDKPCSYYSNTYVKLEGLKNDDNRQENRSHIDNNKTSLNNSYAMNVDMKLLDETSFLYKSELTAPKSSSNLITDLDKEKEIDKEKDDYYNQIHESYTKLHSSSKPRSTIEEPNSSDKREPMNILDLKHHGEIEVKSNTNINYNSIIYNNKKCAKALEFDDYKFEVREGQTQEHSVTTCNNSGLRMRLKAGQSQQHNTQSANPLKLALNQKDNGDITLYKPKTPKTLTYNFEEYTRKDEKDENERKTNINEEKTDNTNQVSNNSSLENEENVEHYHANSKKEKESLDQLEKEILTINIKKRMTKLKNTFFSKKFGGTNATFLEKLKNNEFSLEELEIIENEIRMIEQNINSSYNDSSNHSSSYNSGYNNSIPNVQSNLSNTRLNQTLEEIKEVDYDRSSTLNSEPNIENIIELNKKYSERKTKIEELNRIRRNNECDLALKDSRSDKKGNSPNLKRENSKDTLTSQHSGRSNSRNKTDRSNTPSNKSTSNKPNNAVYKEPVSFENILRTYENKFKKTELSRKDLPNKTNLKQNGFSNKRINVKLNNEKEVSFHD